MFTYVGLFRLAPIAREHIEKTPEYFEKIHKIVEIEGGTVERFLAVMGPWEYLGIFQYPDLETAFRVLGKIAKLEVFETETFPAEDVKLFWKELVQRRSSSSWTTAWAASKRPTPFAKASWVDS
jgi:uncharacterized protein with GYD domain